MSEVKRYEVIADKYGDGTVEPSDAGSVVFYEDYAALKAELDALAVEVANTREQAEHVYAAGYNHGHLNTVDGIAYAPGIKDEFYHNALQVMMEAETPSTDSYLNAVRAEGVDYVAGHLDALQRNMMISSNSLREYAVMFRAGELVAQLRAGKDGE